MSSIDEQFVEFVVKSLVNNPDKIKIDRRIDEKGVLLELTVDPEDLGRVIGKRGATAQSIRTLLRALGTKNDARYNLKIVDNGYGDHARSQQSNYSEDQQYQPASDDNNDQSSVSDTDNDTDNDIDSQATEEKQVEDEPLDNIEEEAKEDTSDRLSKARKELEELDDLDV